MPQQTNSTLIIEFSPKKRQIMPYFRHYFQYFLVTMKIGQNGNIERNIAKHGDQIVVKIVVSSRIMTTMTTVAIIYRQSEKATEYSVAQSL